MFQTFYVLPYNIYVHCQFCLTQRVFLSNPPQSTNQNIYISATVVSSVRFGESLLILCKNAKFDNISHFWKLNYDNTEMTSIFLFTFPYLGMNLQKFKPMKNMAKPTCFDWKPWIGENKVILRCFCSQRGLKMAKKEMFSPWLPENYEEHSFQNWHFFPNIEPPHLQSFKS